MQVPVKNKNFKTQYVERIYGQNVHCSQVNPQNGRSDRGIKILNRWNQEQSLEIRIFFQSLFSIFHLDTFPVMGHSWIKIFPKWVGKPKQTSRQHCQGRTNICKWKDLIGASSWIHLWIFKKTLETLQLSAYVLLPRYIAEGVRVCVCVLSARWEGRRLIWNRLTVAIKEVLIKLSEAIYSVNNQLCPTVTFDSGSKFEIYVSRTYADHLVRCASS